MTNPEARHVEIMDTTLRDGEQTPDVAYTPAEKLQLARLLLLDVEVDRIEIASTPPARRSVVPGQFLLQQIYVIPRICG